jgi:hypothetical protein
VQQLPANPALNQRLDDLDTLGIMNARHPPPPVTRGAGCSFAAADRGQAAPGAFAKPKRKPPLALTPRVANPLPPN